MKRTNIFATKEEIESIKTAQSVSGMFLTGGQPMGEPLKEAHRLALKHGLPKIRGYYGIDLRNGEFLEA